MVANGIPGRLGKIHTMILYLYILSILLASIGDGLFDKGKKLIGHAMEALSVGLILISPYFVDAFTLYHIGGYLLVRVALYDPCYNLTRGLNICFIGTTSWWDKFVMLFNPPCWAMLFGRGIFLFTGIMILIQMI